MTDRIVWPGMLFEHFLTSLLQHRHDYHEYTKSICLNKFDLLVQSSVGRSKNKSKSEKIKRSCIINFKSIRKGSSTFLIIRKWLSSHLIIKERWNCVRTVNYKQKLTSTRRLHWTNSLFLFWNISLSFLIDWPEFIVAIPTGGWIYMPLSRSGHKWSHSCHWLSSFCGLLLAATDSDQCLSPSRTFVAIKPKLKFNEIATHSANSWRVYICSNIL